MFSSAFLCDFNSATWKLQMQRTTIKCTTFTITHFPATYVCNNCNNSVQVSKRPPLFLCWTLGNTRIHRFHPCFYLTPKNWKYHHGNQSAMISCLLPSCVLKIVLLEIQVHLQCLWHTRSLKKTIYNILIIFQINHLIKIFIQACLWVK